MLLVRRSSAHAASCRLPQVQGSTATAHRSDAAASFSLSDEVQPTHSRTLCSKPTDAIPAIQTDESAAHTGALVFLRDARAHVRSNGDADNWAREQADESAAGQAYQATATSTGALV